MSGTWGTSKIDGTLTGAKLDIRLSDAEGNPAGTLTGTFGRNIYRHRNPQLAGRGGRGGGGAEVAVAEAQRDR